jgi:hypothetical protein
MNLRPIAAAAPEVALRGTVLRLVQQQGINSLEPLVDNLEQLARLEAMVASSKPPLRHGSRFGSRQYRGIFYGSRSRSGCLVEGAYYSPTGPANSSAPGCAIIGRSHHFPLSRRRQAASFWARAVSDRWGISRGG